METTYDDDCVWPHILDSLYQAQVTNYDDSFGVPRNYFVDLVKLFIRRRRMLLRS